MPVNEHRTSFQHKSNMRNGQNIPQIAVAANIVAEKGKGRYSERKGLAALKGYNGGGADSSMADSKQNFTTIDTQEPLSAQGGKTTFNESSISENRRQSLLHS